MNVRAFKFSSSRGTSLLVLLGTAGNVDLEHMDRTSAGLDPSSTHNQGVLCTSNAYFVLFGFGSPIGTEKQGNDALKEGCTCTLSVMQVFVVMHRLGLHFSVATGERTLDIVDTAKTQQ